MREGIALVLLAACGRIGFDEVGPDSGVAAACVIGGDVGSHSACALLDDGGVWCWGFAERGQLGNGVVMSTVFAPARVLDGPYSQLVVGGNFACAIRRADAGVECWGSAGNRQLGPNATVDSATPVEVGIATDELVTGNEYACARAGDAAVCWGDNDAAQLGANSLSDYLAMPTTVALADPMVLAGGDDHGCMGTSTGAACWGVNELGQLSVPPAMTTDVCEDHSDTLQPCSLAPVTVAGITSPVTALGLGRSFGCALVNGQVLCWGAGTLDQLGDGLSMDRTTPAPITGVTTAVAISIGKDSGCATLVDDTVWCWGDGGTGELGTGTLQDQPAPVMVPALTGVTLFSSSPGANTRCGLRGDEVVCWGDNEFGIVAGAPDLAVSTPTVVMPRCP